LPLGWVLFHAVASRYHQPRVPSILVARSCIAGCAAVVPYMALEEFFLGAPWPLVIWTMFTVIAIESLGDRRNRRSARYTVSVYLP